MQINVLYVKLHVEVGHNYGRKCCKMYTKEIQVKETYCIYDTKHKEMKILLFYLEFKIKYLYIMT